MSLVKLPNAKKYLEVDSDVFLREICRVLKFGYGYEFNVNDFEFTSDEDKETVVDFFNNTESLNSRKQTLAALGKEIEYTDDFTIGLSLPGTDRFFAANLDEVSHATSVLYAYDTLMTKENTQVRLDDLNSSELKDLFNECVANVPDNKFGSFLYSFYTLCKRIEANGESIEQCKSLVETIKFYAE